MSIAADRVGHSQAGTVKKPRGLRLSTICWRLIWLPGMLRVLREARVSRLAKAELDAELLLYSRMLPNGYLHYGYFENPKLSGEEVSFDDLSRAQQCYADRLVDLICDPENPVLDVGCGMGGISFLLADRGYAVTSLTPDRHQAMFVRSHRPGHTVIESTFEDYAPVESELGSFGTVLTSESLQYLDLEQSLPKIKALLRPGGRWIACDYFRLHNDEEGSGHHWESFVQALRAQGFRVSFQEDITDHVLPTLRFASVLANRFVQPVWMYLQSKIQSKRPGIFYLLEGLFDKAGAKIDKALLTLGPAEFRRKKKYVLLAIELQPD